MAHRTKDSREPNGRRQDRQEWTRHSPGTSLEELIQASVTLSPPGEFVRSTPTFCAPRGTPDSQISMSKRLSTSTAENLPWPDGDRNPLSSTFFRSPNTKRPIEIPAFEENKTPPALEFPFQFNFTANMVREQEPAKTPFSPAKMHVPPRPQPADKQNQPFILGQATSTGTLQAQPVASEKPVFGQSTVLGPPQQSQQFISRSANTSAPRQVSGSKSDSYSNLFIPSKNRQQRPEHYKPQQTGNPLHHAKDWAFQQARKALEHHDNKASSKIQPSRPSQDEDFFEIPKPANFPTWQPKPTAPPVFSSQTTTNPYYQPKTLIDLTTGIIGSATSAMTFDDRFGASDPYTYIDLEKANENIKALLEGAMEDEDEKPRTRRRKKLLKEKGDDLVDKLKGMNVKDVGADGDPEDDEKEDEDDGSVEGLKVKLLPHQVEGVAWMRDKELGTTKTRGVLPKGGILADDMGLGKTIQSIALMLMNPKPSAEETEQSTRKLPPNLDKGTLVVAPLALIKQWEGEIRDRVEGTHTMRVCVHHGPQRAKSFKDLKKYDVVITTYATLASEHANSEGVLKTGCFGLNWYRVILDEAHSIKNRNTKATKAACALEAEYRWCLTGTPMQNNLDELQSLIHFLRIKPYDDLNAWREQITRPMQNGRGGLAIKRLQIYLKAFMKRRTKDVLKQGGALKNGAHENADGSKGDSFKIVKRTIEKVEAEFSREEREFYLRLESRTDRSLEQMMAGNKVSYASALTLLLRLRQACNHPKLIGGDLSKERDVFVNVGSPRKAGANDDMDSIANMLGGLSVETKRCDICQIELTARESSTGSIRCRECENDLAAQDANVKRREERRREKKALKQAARAVARRRKNHRVLEDSDEDQEDIVPARLKKADVIGPAPEDDEDTEDSTDESGSGSDSDSLPRLADLVTSTKIRQLLTILRHDSATNKYIVFSFFTSMLDLIEPFLHRAHIPYTRYDGQMRNDHREASLDKLRTDASCRVLLCSLRAGSLGLNLTAASRVVILEPFWNPFVEEQAIDRVHRLNQTEDVIVHKITVRDTVEARIVELQERKRELANATIEGKTAATKLTLQDMLKLFRHDAEHEHQVDGIGMRDGRGLLETGDWVGAGESSSRGGSHGPGQARRKEHEVYGRRW